jgi:predicted permease
LIFFVTTVIVSNTFGVFLASRGAASSRRALLNVLVIPMPYAALLGIVFNLGDVTIPAPFQRAITLLSDAANPCMLVVLGLQLSRAKMIRGRIKPILLASSMRLVVAPLLVLIPVVVLGMTGLTRQVALVEAAMPTAVIAGVLATEFGSDSEFVTGTILVSTLLSIITLSVLLSWVM